MSLFIQVPKELLQLALEWLEEAQHRVLADDEEVSRCIAQLKEHLK